MPTVVFLHGWGGSIASFLPVARRLRFCDRLLFDFCGFGKSKMQKAMTLDDYCDETLALLDEYGIQQAVFVGHSFGCRVAVRIAARSPQRVKALVITDGAGLKPRRGIRYHAKVFAHKLRKKLGLDTSKGGSADYRNADGFLKKTFVNIVNEYTDDDCRDVDCPVLLVWGKKDKDTPLYMQKRYAKLLANSRTVLLEGDHFCYVRELDAYCRELKKFLKEV